MQSNFIEVFDYQLNKVNNINDGNEESSKFASQNSLQELDAAGHVVYDTTYKALHTFSFIFASFLHPLLLPSVTNV